MDNEAVDTAVSKLFSDPVIIGFRAGAIKERTGMDEEEIEKRLDELAHEGHLIVVWELVCNSCSHLLAKYPEKPNNIETFQCRRCQIEPVLSEDDLHKSYFRPGRHT